MLGDSTELMARAIEAGLPPTHMALRVYRRMWHCFPMYAEACRLADRGRVKGVDPDTVRRLGLPHARRAIIDLAEWVARHPPLPPLPALSHPRSAPARSRLCAGLLAALPVVLVELTTGGWTQPWAVLGAIAVVANSLVRLRWPSSYCPRSQVGPSLVCSPLTARALATAAEFVFYAQEAATLGLAFWPAAPLGLLTYLGEALCWAHVLFQSELLGCLKDCTWAVHQLFALLLSANPLKYVLCLLHVLIALPGGHLQRQLSRVRRPWLGLAPYWRSPPSVGLPPYDGDLMWAVHSLIAKPLAYALLRVARPEQVAGEAWALWTGALPALIVVLLLALRRPSIRSGAFRW